MLGEIMFGGTPRKQPATLAIPPGGIATRQSTDITATNDPLVKRAWQIICQQAVQGMTAEQLVI